VLVPKLVFEIVVDLRLSVMCQGTENPTDAEWDAYIDALGPLLALAQGYRVLVVTEGGHPSRSQQKKLRDRTAMAKPQVGILTAAAGVRFVASVLALANSNLRCYAPDQRHAALAYLGLQPGEVAVVDALLKRLLLQLAPARPTAA
jgi:hypothetical protein